MIITNAIICHIPTSVFAYGANSSYPGPFITPYAIYEKLQITIFFLQEFIISGLYIYSSANILKPSGNIRSGGIRTAMSRLILINAVIVVLDLTVLATEYSGHYAIQVIYKGAVYSIKLKMEFRILTQLVAITKPVWSPREWSQDLAVPSSKERIARKFQQLIHPEMGSDNHIVEVSGGSGNHKQEKCDEEKQLPQGYGGITMERQKVTQYIIPADRAYLPNRRHTDGHTGFILREERTIDREKVPWSSHGGGDKWAKKVSQSEQVEGIGRSLTERSLKAGFSKIYRLSQLESGERDLL
jgi:hypothetical protein